MANEQGGQEMAKTYDPQTVEQKWYTYWESHNFFKPVIDKTKQPFVISMPPPNVTGELHLGHALPATIEDILIRYHRMVGDPTLWVPGIDHAGIATQVVVEKILAQEGTNRHALGREKFVERVWQWKEKYGNRIFQQHRRLGVSCDWTRERFTLDAGLSQAVREVFVRLYEEGLIYRGERIISWCPRCQSALSDLEVSYQEATGTLWYIRYPVLDEQGRPTEGAIIVATTRPETMLGDTAVAVHPEDSRFTALHGRSVLLPIMERPIPIVADAMVDREFGTGAVKVTPAHDPNDFEVGQRHKLPSIMVIGLDGKMTAEAGPFKGQDRYAARKGVLNELEAGGYLVKTAEHLNKVGHCSRCDTVVEPLLSKQWFVTMKPLAEPAIAAAHEQQMVFVPERFTKVYLDWLENIRDWCISRQLWWGHRIPAWYCSNCGQISVSRTNLTACTHCRSTEVTQDPDVLDTWFSSALWPFSTLGWPEKTADVEYFYPTSVMETGYDIIFFWVARMAMMGLYFLGNVPFHTVYLHGLIRDEKGQKMSKSRGNVVNPLEVMDQFGTDALRFTLATGSTPGNDMKLVKQRIEGNRNFANKIWNATRLVLQQTSDLGEEDREQALSMDLTAITRQTSGLTLADRWITSRCNRLTGEVTRLLNDFQLGEAGRQIYEFFWTEFCDWYLEIAKAQGQAGERTRRSTQILLLAIMEQTMRLLHPYMPFVTEEVWQHLHGPGAAQAGQSIMVSAWPQPGPVDEQAEAHMELVKEIVTRIRDARTKNGTPPAKRIKAIIQGGQYTSLLREQVALLEFLARVQDPQLRETLPHKPAQALSIIIGEVEVYLPLAEMLDLARERSRLEKEISQAQGEIARVEAMLANEAYLAKAPPKLVEENRAKLTGFREKEQKLHERLHELPV